MTIDSIYSKQLELINEDIKEDELFASLATHNPNVRWMKFVLLDDQPNANKHRVPSEEFSNVIKTGMHMPLKTEAGKFNGDHAGSTPIGVITNLMKESNKVIGLAALWQRERPDDVKLIKEAYDEGKPLNISWELTYEDSEEKDEYSELHGISVNAATLVGMPAYEGRTPVTAVASTQDIPQKEEGKLEELEQLKNEKEALIKEKEELSSKVTSLESELTAKNSELESAKTQLSELVTYKETNEKEKADSERLLAIKNKFTEAGLEFDEATLEDEDKRKRFLSLSDEALDFIIQETIAFKNKIETETSSIKVPRLHSNPVSGKSPKELARLLREKELKENK